MSLCLELPVPWKAFKPDLVILIHLEIGQKEIKECLPYFTVGELNSQQRAATGSKNRSKILGFVSQCHICRALFDQSSAGNPEPRPMAPSGVQTATEPF